MKICQVVFELSFPRTHMLFSMKLTTFLTYFLWGEESKIPYLIRDYPIVARLLIFETKNSPISEKSYGYGSPFIFIAFFGYIHT